MHGVGTFGLDASMPTGTASAALLLLLAVCVRARAWVCTTPFALASLELNRDCAVVPVCVFRRSAAGMRTSLSVCLQDELAIIWADLVAKITAANATAIPYCGTRVWRALQGLTE